MGVILFMNIEKELAELLALTLILTKDIVSLTEKQNKIFSKINELLDVPERLNNKTDISTDNN